MSIENQEGFRTRLGALLTCFLGVISLAVIILFGKDLVVKRNPQVISANLRDEEAVLKGEDLFFGMRVTLQGGIFLDSSFFEVDFGSMRINYTTEDFSFKFSSSIPCEQSERYRNISEKIPSKIEYMCPPDDYYEDLVGTAGQGTAFAYDIRVKLCTNTTENNNHCKPKEEIKSKVIFGSLLFRDNLVDPMELNEPMSSFYRLMTLRLSSQTSREETFYYKAFELGTDLGFIMESISWQRYFIYNKIQGDIFPDEDPRYIFRVKITSENTKIKMIRSYIKVQKVAADIGGIIKFFMICASVISNLYGRFHFLVYMRDRLIEEQKEALRMSRQEKIVKRASRMPFTSLIRLDSLTQSALLGNKNSESQLCKEDKDKIMEIKASKVSVSKQGMERVAEELSYQDGNASHQNNDCSVHPINDIKNEEDKQSNDNIQNKILKDKCSPEESRKEEEEILPKSLQPDNSVNPMKSGRNITNNYVNKENAHHVDIGKDKQYTNTDQQPIQIQDWNSDNIRINNPKKSGQQTLQVQSLLKPEILIMEESLSHKEEGQSSCTDLRSFLRYYCVCRKYKETTLKLINRYIRSCYSLEKLLEMKENQNLLIRGLFTNNSESVLKELRVENTVHQVKRKLAQVSSKEFLRKIQEIKE